MLDKQHDQKISAMSYSCTEHTHAFDINDTLMPPSDPETRKSPHVARASTPHV